MRNLLDYVNAFYDREAALSDSDIAHINSLLELMFFEYIAKPHKRLRWSREYKTACELRKIRSLLDKEQPSLKGLKIQSPRLRKDLDYIKGYLEKDILTEHEIDDIKRQYLTKYRCYEKAVFLASIVDHDFGRERRRWILGGLLGFVAGLLIHNLPILLELLGVSLGSPGP